MRLKQERQTEATSGGKPETRVKLLKLHIEVHIQLLLMLGRPHTFVHALYNRTISYKST